MEDIFLFLLLVVILDEIISLCVKLEINNHLITFYSPKKRGVLRNFNMWLFVRLLIVALWLNVVKYLTLVIQDDK